LIASKKRHLDRGAAKLTPLIVISTEAQRGGETSAFFFALVSPQPTVAAK
jgi:hypothetical protein